MSSPGQQPQHLRSLCGICRLAKDRIFCRNHRVRADDKRLLRLAKASGNCFRLLRGKLLDNLLKGKSDLFQQLPSSRGG